MRRNISPGNPHPGGVAVFCGARTGHDPAYRRDAVTIGRGLAERGLRMVFGGGETGLMGAAAEAARAAGGSLLGVVPRDVFDSGISPGAPHIVTAQSLRERKALMLANAHAIVILAGGVGTLDELAESLVERQLGIHQEPIILVNTNGYWSGFHESLKTMAAEGFVDDSSLSLLTLAADGADALRRIDQLIKSAVIPR